MSLTRVTSGAIADGTLVTSAPSYSGAGGNGIVILMWTEGY